MSFRYFRALSESEIQALNTNADFTADKISGEPPLTVQFTDASAIDEPITSWAWDFDNDGTIDSTDQHPTYTYNDKGLYSANLTVSDGENEHTITKNDFILVYDALLSLNTPVPNTLTSVDQSGEYIMEKGFEVVAGNEAKLETNLVLPGVLGRHAVATLYVEYKNTGNIAMPAPLLILRSADEDDSDKPILTLDNSRVVQNLWTSTMPEGASHAVQFLADGDDDSPGVLQPGESGRIPVYYTGAAMGFF